MKLLSRRQILMLHSMLIAQSGGMDGLRDEGLLGYGLIHNHPFVDGNKRIGTHAMLVFLDINSITLSYEDDDLISVILRVAAGDMDDHGLLEWLKNHIE